MRLLYLVEILQKGFVNQIRPCADDDADDFRRFYGFGTHVIPCVGMWVDGIYGLQSLLINPLQLLQRLVSVRKRLEISQILARPAIPPLMEYNAFLDLQTDAFLRLAIRRIERRIAAKSTAARAGFPVAVRAAEARVDADFLHPAAELPFEVAAVAVETAAIELVCGYWSLAHWLGGVVILLLKYAESVCFYDFTTTKLQLFSHLVSFLMKNLIQEN